MWVDQPNIHYGISIVIILLLLIDVLWIIYLRLGMQKKARFVSDLKNDGVIFLPSLKELAATNFSPDRITQYSEAYYCDKNYKYGFRKKGIVSFLVMRSLFILLFFAVVLLYRDIAQIERVHFLIALPISFFIWCIFLGIKISSAKQQLISKTTAHQSKQL